MPLSPLLLFHIATASIGLLSGAAALILAKGSRRHRLIGNVFFISMLCMSASAEYIAITKPDLISIVPGALTFYLVASAWVTVRRKAGTIGRFEAVAPLFALTVGITGFVLGWGPAHTPKGLDRDGYPAAAYFIFGSVALLCAALDVRLLLRRGIDGAQRIARHLWRMCFALLIATSSFFQGQEQVFPAAIRKTQLLSVPPLLVALALVFWLARVLFTRKYRKAHTPPRPAKAPVAPQGSPQTTGAASGFRPG